MKKIITLVVLAVSLCLAAPSTTEAAPKLVNKNGVKVTAKTMASKKKETIKIKGGKIKSISVKNKKVCTVKYTKYSKKKKNSGTSFTITAKKNTSSKAKKTTLTIKCTNGKKLKFTVTVKGTGKTKNNSSSSNSSSKDVDEDADDPLLKRYAELAELEQSIEYKTHQYYEHDGGKTFNVSVMKPKLAKKVKLSSTDPKVATVDGNGKVTVTGAVGSASIVLVVEYSGIDETEIEVADVYTDECLYGDYVVIKEETCGTPGILEWKCPHGYHELNKDGTPVQEVIEPTADHKMSQWKITKYPTAEEGTNGLTAKREDYGTAYSVCENCGGNRVDVVVAKIGVGRTGTLDNDTPVTYDREAKTVTFDNSINGLGISGPFAINTDPVTGVEYILVFGQFADDYSKKMETELDAYRAELGLPSVRHDVTAFQDIARLRTVEASVCWTHERPMKHTAGAFTSIENLFGAASGPYSAIESWKNSPAHNDAMCTDSDTEACNIAAFNALYVEDGDIVCHYGATVLSMDYEKFNRIINYDWR